MDFYEFIEQCKANGLTAEEASREWADACEEKRQAFYDSYYSDPYVVCGAIQQDTIDMYRRER